MLSNTFTFTDPEGVRVHVYRWDPEEGQPVRGVVQIAHGMTETARRYSRFAEALTDAGYIVYGNDHRGHGRTAERPEDLGYVGEDGFTWMVRNMAQLTEIIHSEQAGLPVFLFAHSMGSFLAQKYIAEHGGKINGVILCGSNGPRGPELHAGVALTKLIAAARGSRHRSKMIDNMAFGGFNRTFRPSRTSFDWLSRDEQEVDKYVADPECGFLSTIGFYRDFFGLLQEIYHPQTMQAIPKELPVMLIAGERDPVGQYGKGVQRLAEMYRELGMREVECILYPEARHELLNEKNRDEVTSDCLSWLRQHTS